MASCGGTCSGKKGADLEWFKISQQNYDNQTKTWPINVTTPGIETKFTLPTKLPGGQYLLSQTLIAMHSHDGPQYYVSAFEIDFESNGASLPEPRMYVKLYDCVGKNLTLPLIQENTSHVYRTSQRREPISFDGR